METLDVIFDKYDTDKNSSFHNYTRQYEALLNNFRGKPIKYLEIGVFNGGSVKAMREVFKNGECILGLDINENELQRTAGVSLTIYQPENLASLIKSRRAKQDNKSVIEQFKKARQSAVATH